MFSGPIDLSSYQGRSLEFRFGLMLKSGVSSGIFFNELGIESSLGESKPALEFLVVRGDWKLYRSLADEFRFLFSSICLRTVAIVLIEAFGFCCFFKML